MSGNGLHVFKKKYSDQKQPSLLQPVEMSTLNPIAYLKSEGTDLRVRQ